MLSKEDETFVTQRGGKMYLKLILTNRLLDDRRTLQSTLLLQKKKEMEHVQTLLEQKRQKQIRERVTKFEKFLKENDAKRQRANIKAMAERKLTETKEQELQALKAELQTEQVKFQRVVMLIKRHEKYEKYLQSIVDILPPDYLDVNEPHINDILMRHKTLTETNQDLISVVQKNQDEIESLHTKLAALVKEKNDLILVYNSKLGTQQKHLDKLKQDCAYYQQRIEERDNTLMRLLSATKLAIDDLYDRCTRKIARSAEPLDDHVSDSQERSLSEKLHTIQFRVLDLQGMFSH
ncbi:hypothetical protein EDD86DRAFT_247071 [Gorgonomyces haynaldii]|nr:hypothetical protein EDD86DRAFT_247071 [Gorgonomyces haynaldii]